MAFGIRTPNIKKSIKARTTGKVKRTIKKSVNPLYGKKGMGYINDPKKAVYNKIYNKTTVDARPISLVTGATASKKNNVPSIENTQSITQIPPLTYDELKIIRNKYLKKIPITIVICLFTMAFSVSSDLPLLFIFAFSFSIGYIVFCLMKAIVLSSKMSKLQ